MEIRLYFQMLRRGWWVIALVTLAALAVSLVISMLTVPLYTSVATFVITPNPSIISGPDLIRGLDVLGNQAVVSTYSEVMNSNRIYDSTLQLLNLKPQEVSAYKYDAVVLPSTSVIQLSVTGPNPVVTAQLANAFGQQTIDFTRQINQVYDFNFLDAAVPPTTPVSPQPLRDASLALVLGLVAGAALVILGEEIRIPLESYRERQRTDSATGVYNRAYFPRLIDAEVGQHPNQTLSAGIIELTGLRDLLETLPGSSVQTILQNVTSSLRKELRGNDMIGRWDPLSFVVMLPNTSGVDATRIFERIHEVLSAPADMGQLDSMADLDPHVGGAEYGDNLSTEDLLNKAETALAQARRAKSTPVVVLAATRPLPSKGGKAA
jgi:diguanylate cyclase (GGDEF)-like protein